MRIALRSTVPVVARRLGTARRGHAGRLSMRACSHASTAAKHRRRTRSERAVVRAARCRGARVPYHAGRKRAPHAISPHPFRSAFSFACVRRSRAIRAAARCLDQGQGRNLRRVPRPRRQFRQRGVSGPGGAERALHLPAVARLQGRAAQGPVDGSDRRAAHAGGHAGDRRLFLEAEADAERLRR